MHASPLALLRPLLVGLLLTPLAAPQGESGFLRGTGHLDVSTSYSIESYDKVRLENPVERFRNRSVRTFGLYAAYGLRDDLDLVFSGAYQSSRTDGEPAFDDQSNLQDATLRAKWRAWQRPLGPGQFSWLVAPGIRFPLTDYPSYADNPLNGLGTGDTVLLGRMIAHYQWSSSYAAFETGYDRHNGRLDDEIPLLLSLGTTVGRVTYQAFLSSVYALGDEISHPRLSDERDGYVRAGLGGYVRVSQRFGLSFSLFASDDGKNDSQGLSLGTVFRW